jgi:serine/threonine protein kinase
VADGGMASVYKAKDLQNPDSPILALKILHRSLLTEVLHVERFIQEARLLTTIHNPSVIELFDVGQGDGMVFLSMPYIEAPTLHDLIHDQGVPFTRAPKLIRSICEGLQALHDAGIIHRDIKPANILVLNDYSVKITDLGIARVRESRLTQPKQKVGSLSYIPPEAWLGEPTDQTQDFYALGVCIYEMITQINPFESELPAAVMKLHLGKGPLEPRVFSQGVPNWLNDLTMWLLNRKPSGRPQAANEIINFIDKYAKETRTDGILSNSATMSSVRAVKKRPKTYIFSLDASSLSASLSAVEMVSKDVVKPRSRTVCITLPRNSAFVFEFEPPSRDVVAAGILLGSLQVFDGYLTSRGISHFGTQAEANFLIRELMHLMGPDVALIVVKGLAILVVVLLTKLARRQRGLKHIINGLCAIYMIMAIIPWVYILVTRV